MGHSLVIDATRLVRRALQGRTPTGIDRTSLAYIEHYRHRARAMLIWGWWGFVLPEAASQRLWSLLLRQGRYFRGRLRWLLPWGAIASIGSSRGPAGRILLNTGHTGLDRGLYRGLMSRHGYKPVFLIHDLIPVTHPEYCRAGEGKRHAARIKTALECGVALIVNSKATLEQLTQHAGLTRMAVPATVLAPLAPGLKRQAPGERPIAAPYFVILGTIEPRKNHWMLL